MTKEIHFRNLERFGFGPNVMKKIKICPKCGQIAKKRFIFLPRLRYVYAARNIVRSIPRAAQMLSRMRYGVDSRLAVLPELR
jgi:hypothetical protein